VREVHAHGREIAKGLDRHVVGPPIGIDTAIAVEARTGVAERAGFEPATGCPEPHFQCGAIVH
jgi:hypothetical protein